MSEISKKTHPTRKTRKPSSMLAQKFRLFSALEYLRTKYIRPKTAHIFSKNKYFNFGDIYVRKRGVIKRDMNSDLSRKEVKANFDISKTIFSVITKELRDKGIKFKIIIIPSKRIVIEQWAVNNSVEVPEKFPIYHEKELISKYLAFFKKNGIPAIDTTSLVVEAFTKSTQSGEEFYPFEDGHPREEGYRAYSLAAEKLMSEINQS